MNRSRFAARIPGSIFWRGVAAAFTFASGVGTRAATPGEPGPPQLVLVLVVDGLRPDLIDADTTPNLHRLRREGVDYVNAHSAFPTVTRVNAAVIVTGTHPQSTGITSNTLYDRRVNGGQPFNTGDAANLWPFAEVRGGRMVQSATLGETLAAAGRSFAVVSSGSTGQAILLNPEVRRGSGVVINGGFEGGKRTAYPDLIDAEIRRRFGLKPTDPKSDSLEWTERVLREYVLGELKPAVLIDWLTEPDHTQHRAGVGSPESLAAIRRSDQNIGRTLELLEREDRLQNTAVIVTSDHGFIAHEEGVGMTEALVRAGLKQSVVSRDVILTSDGQSAQFFIENRETGKIRALVEFLQRQPWTDAVFVDAQKRTEARRPDEAASVSGWLPGTFSLPLIHLAPTQGRPDIVVTLRWRSAPNAFGHSGRQTVMQAKSGPITSTASGHGGMSPWVVRTPLILWGRYFKQRTTVRLPAGNVDLTPTVLALVGLAAEAGSEGRVLGEAFLGGPDPEKDAAVTEVHEVSDGRGFRAAIQISSAGGTRYIDKSWRIDSR